MAGTSDAAAYGIALIRRFVREVQQDGNLDLIDELCHPDFHDYTAAPGMASDLNGLRAGMGYIQSTIKDLKIEIVHCISDGNLVATHKILRGIQVGDIFGKPATNKPIEFRISDFITIVDGKSKDHWNTISQIIDV